MRLERNPELDCAEFDFFDAFSGLDFDFILTDTADYISYQPNFEVKAFDPTIADASASEVAFGDRAPA